MAEQYCPQCGNKAFVWSIDEEISNHTQWYCSLCNYHAEENEALESPCDKCNITSMLYLKNGNEFFRFCTNCKLKYKADPW